MKVLITSDWYAPVINGVVTSVLLLQRELEKLGHEVRVVTLSNSLHTYKDGNVYYMGSVSANKIYPGARLKINRSRSLLHELVAWGPDVIHSQCEFSSFRVAYALSSRLGTPIVHTYHTVYEDYTHYFSPSVRVGRAVVSVFSRWICGRTACVVAPSRKVEKLLRDYGVRCRIEVIPTGVDLGAYRQEPDAARMAELRRRWALKEGRTVLLYLGRMAKEKNLERLIDQIAAAGRRDVTLLLVGDGPDREEVLDYAREKGLDVVFTGMVPHGEVADYYRLGDLFVTASTSETQGLTYFEALAERPLRGRSRRGRRQRLAVRQRRGLRALSVQLLRGQGAAGADAGCGPGVVGEVFRRGLWRGGGKSVRLRGGGRHARGGRGALVI